MKVLLTGCAGFVGSHTTEKLLEEGHEVHGIDNFSKFYDRSIKERNLAHFIQHPNFHFYELDIRNKEELEDIPLEKANMVVHLAAKAGVRPSIINIDKYIDVNVKGTQHILEWMIGRDCNKLFFASSSSVYGNNSSGTASKEHELDDHPISPYAFTKRAAELLNHSFHHLHQIDVINARFFTIYGPRQRPDLAIHKFANLIDQGKAIEMYGDGSTARDYTFISDAVQGIMKGIHYLLNTDTVYETINIGNQSPVVLKEMIDLLYQQLGREKQVIQKGMQEGDVDITCADISKAKKLLAYLPQVSFEEGIAQFTNWYSEVNQELRFK